MVDMNAPYPATQSLENKLAGKSGYNKLLQRIWKNTSLSNNVVLNFEFRFFYIQAFLWRY